MTLILDNDDVLAAADMSVIISALEEAMAIESLGGVDSVPRINLPAGAGGFLRVMPVVISDLDLMGLKAFNSNKGGAVRYLICVWAINSGELLALVDASALTAIRTGAVTGVAQRAIAAGRFDGEVGVIGSGMEARTNLEAICAVSAITGIKVYSPRQEKRERFAAAMASSLEIDARAVDSPAEAAGAGTVLVATNTGVNSGCLALEADWLPARGHVNAIGSTMPSLREVDEAAFGRADMVVLDTLDAVEESGDLRAAVERDLWDASRVRPLMDFFGDGTRPAPNDGDQLTIFKSVGTGLQDLVAAKAIFDTACQLGIGREADVLSAKQFENLTAPTVGQGD